MTEWLKILLEHAGYEVRTALIGTRGEELFKAKLIPKQDFDQRKAALDGAQASVTEQRARLTQAKAQVAKIVVPAS